jgi:L-ascorbate 6-phosphate lactonase
MNLILRDLLAVQDGIGLCWLGNLGWLIRAGGRLVAFDLDLDRPVAGPIPGPAPSDTPGGPVASTLNRGGGPVRRLRPSPVPTADLAPVLDVVFITHEHGDHFGEATARILAECSRCAFVVPASCVARARAFGIPESRLTVARPRQPFSIAGIPVEPQRALHGHTRQSVYRGANLDDCGYALTLGGRKLFQPGDSVLLQDHLEDLTGVSILFVSPTEHNTHIAPSRTLVEAINPDFVFPQHFGTYLPTDQNRFWTVGYPDELRASLAPELQQRFHTLEQGQLFHIAP